MTVKQRKETQTNQLIDLQKIADEQWGEGHALALKIATELMAQTSLSRYTKAVHAVRMRQGKWQRHSRS